MGIAQPHQPSLATHHKRCDQKPEQSVREAEPIEEKSMEAPLIISRVEQYSWSYESSGGDADERFSYLL